METTQVKKLTPVRLPEIEEAVRIQRARQGDEIAFTELVDEYRKPVYNFCYRMLGEPETAEEASQETFLRLYLNLSHYDTARSFATWLLSIAAHHCIDRLRRARFLTFSWGEEQDLETSLSDRSAPDPEQETIHRLDGERLHDLIQKLDPLQRSILILRYWQGLSEAEIAGILHITPPAVRSRLHRVRCTLARLWRDQAGSLVMNARPVIA